MVFILALSLLSAAFPLRAPQQASTAFYREVEAAFQQGKLSQAEQMLRARVGSHPHDARLLGWLGVVLDAEGKYEEAGRYYAEALRLSPNSISLLNNLGNHYLAQGKLGLARKSYLRVTAIEPDFPNANLQLARMSLAAKDGRAALQYLSHLTARDKEQPAAELLQAQALHLQGRVGPAEILLEGLERQGSGDPRIPYTVGMIFASWKRYGEAEEAFNRALEIAPANFDILYNLGLAATHTGHLRRAEELFQTALKQRPGDVDTLYNLAHVDTEQDQPGEAAMLLARAHRLAPERSDILLLMAQVAEKLGYYADAANALSQYLKLKPNDDAARRERQMALARSARSRATSGLFQFAGLPPSAQRNEVIATLEARLQKNPQDAGSRVKLGRELLGSGRAAEGVQTLSVVPSLTSNAGLLTACGKALMDSGQYVQAKTCLKKAIDVDPAKSEGRLDLAIALDHTDSPAAALAELGRVLPEQRNGDYYLLRAEILDGMGKAQEAAFELDQAIRTSPMRPDLYSQASLFLIKHKRYEQALRELQQATRLFPNQPRLELVEAMTYGLMDQPEESQRLLTELESSRPEWSDPYLIHGIELVDHGKSAEARTALQTAIALGAHEAVAYYNLARAEMNSIPKDVSAAREAIQQALQLAPNDAYIQALAGQIAYNRKDYSSALKHLAVALRLWPDMIEAHQTLSATYLALGDREKAAAELQTVFHIKQHNRSALQAPPFSVQSLLFSVPSFVPPAPAAMGNEAPCQ